jgi:hypothetical protein
VGSLLRYNDSRITVQHRGDSRCLLRVETGPVTVRRYDPGSYQSEHTTEVRSNRSQILVNNHFYVLSARESLYFYVDNRGDVIRYSELEEFDEAMLNNSPEAGYRPRPWPKKPNSPPEVVRPTRFERLLRESEVWEEYRPPPKPIPVKKEITEDELAEIFDKPKKLIAAAPDPMGIDITKLMEEVLKS